MASRWARFASIEPSAVDVADVSVPAGLAAQAERSRSDASRVAKRVLMGA